MKYENQIQRDQRMLLAEIAHKVACEIYSFALEPGVKDQMPSEELMELCEMGAKLFGVRDVMKVPIQRQLEKASGYINAAHCTLSNSRGKYDIPLPKDAIPGRPLWGLAGTCPEFMQTALRGVYPFAQAMGNSDVSYSYGLMYVATTGNAGWLPDKIVEFLDSDEYREAAMKNPGLNSAQRWDIDQASCETTMVQIGLPKNKETLVELEIDWPLAPEQVGGSEQVMGMYHDGEWLFYLTLELNV